jgi:membrane associated rhomboid family serine protease
MRLPKYDVRLTYVLIAINALLFVPTMLFGDLVYVIGALLPGLVVQRWQLWRLVTASFLHADIVHIGFNMYALYIFGRQVEQLFGPRRFALIYGGALLGGSAVVVLLDDPGFWTVGASGAILGLLGALMAYFWRYQETVVGARARLGNLLTTALLNVGIGLLPHISLWGHLGGTVTGLVMGLALAPRYETVYGLQPQLEIVDRRSEEWTGVLAAAAGCILLLMVAFLVRG